MAGEWIKMRVDLADDPAVIRIRRATGIDRDAVVGKLHRLWAWADAHTADGFAEGLDAEWVDEFTGCQGFASAMTSAGWLDSEADGIRFANFDRHNGKPAKVRALGKTRMQRIRCATSATESEQERNQRREEKRREEKKEEHTHTQAGKDFSERGGGWAAEAWEQFADRWNRTERARPWTAFTPPDGWVDYASRPGWIEKAGNAMSRLPGCEFFEQPLAVTKFLDFVDRILAGEFDHAKSNGRQRRKPAGVRL